MLSCLQESSILCYWNSSSVLFCSLWFPIWTTMTAAVQEHFPVSDCESNPNTKDWFINVWHWTDVYHWCCWKHSDQTLCRLSPKALCGRLPKVVMFAMFTFRNKTEYFHQLTTAWNVRFKVCHGGSSWIHSAVVLNIKKLRIQFSCEIIYTFTSSSL